LRPPAATRAATSRLLPYTTLFRSVGSGAVRAGTDEQSRRGQVDDEAIRCGHGEVPPARATGGPPAPVRPGTWGRWGSRAAARPGDRKSTRLNSSHVSISYAVFCLK